MKGHALMILLAGALLASCESSTSVSSLSEVQGEWQLQAFELNDGSIQPVPNPENYTIRFAPDGNAHAQVDCNVCNGSFETEGNSISVGVMACTLAACPPGSLDAQYQTALGSMSTFVRSGSELSIRYAGGTMRFELSE
jgi:heat shock protein HslJ